MSNEFKVVLYDGVCVFCERWVEFVIANMREGERIYFYPLQLLNLENLAVVDSLDTESIFCITEKGIIIKNSDASLTVMSSLKSPYGSFAHFGKKVPRGLRDLVYHFIGRNRYKIFGKKKVCSLPDHAQAHRFLNSLDKAPDDVREVLLTIGAR